MDTKPNEEAIFCKAIELPIEERVQFLDHACAGDQSLRSTVDQLIRFHDDQDAFLDTPLNQLEPDKFDDRPGLQIGNYRLLEIVGEGGFGIVWRAQQLKPVSRIVALKIIKLGRNSRSFVERFERERHLLAQMQHPNISTVFDAGTTNDGRPYFAMEFVDGQNVDRYCQSNELPLANRLQLFRDACVAVHHAHQKSVVHRDLKPSNILIQEIDGEPSIKIIDFGIAQSTSAQLGPSTAESADEVAGTPLYMSPEQLQHLDDIDTRSDIYSLGVVFYQLVADTTPWPIQNLASLFGAIMDGHPTPPSQKRELGRRAPELDWIAAKALAKERNARYQSASEFAEDIERFLNHMPLAAAPNRGTYRLSKLLYRNRTIAISLASILVALILCTIVSLVSLSDANHQRLIAEQEQETAVKERNDADLARQIAEKQEEEAKLVATMLKRFLNDLNPALGSEKVSPETMKQLSRFAKSLDSLADHPEVEAELRLTLGDTYLALAKLVGAETNLRRSLELRETHLGVDHPDTINSRIVLSACLIRTGKVKEAEEQLAEVLRVTMDQPPGRELLAAITHMKRIREFQERYEEAYQFGIQSIEYSKQVLGETNWNTLQKQSDLCFTAIGLKKYEEADQWATTAVELMSKHHPEKVFQIANAKFRLAHAKIELNDLKEAERWIKEALISHRSLLGREDERVIRDLIVLARVFECQADWEQAEKIARTAVQRSELMPAAQKVIRASAYRRLAAILENSDIEKAIQPWRRSIEYRKQFKGDHPQVVDHLCHLAFLLRQIGFFDQSESTYREAIEIAEILGPQEVTPRKTYRALAELLTEQSQFEEVETQLQLAHAAAIEANDLEPLILFELLQAILQQDELDTIPHLLDSIKNKSPFDEPMFEFFSKWVEFEMHSEDDQSIDDLRDLVEMIEAAKTQDSLSAHPQLKIRIQEWIANQYEGFADFDRAETILKANFADCEKAVDKRRTVIRLIEHYRQRKQDDKVAEWREVFESTSIDSDL